MDTSYGVAREHRSREANRHPAPNPNGAFDTPERHPTPADPLLPAESGRISPQAKYNE